MWVTILNYMTGEVICKEYDTDKVDCIEEFIQEEVGNFGNIHYMCTESLVLQIEEKNSDEVNHITKN